MLSGRDKTENARRNARFTFARQRLAKMIAAEPRFTAEQFRELAELFLAAEDAAASKAA